jgi:ribonuclease HI
LFAHFLSQTNLIIGEFIQNNGPDDTMTIYTDGSGINGMIGAAIYNATTDETKHQHLGDELRFNVYAGELTALHMGITQWQESDYLRCRIFTDSQAAGTSICQPWRQSGQKLIAPTVDTIDSLTVQSPQRQLEIIWIPGHHGIVGNERADAGAKQAALDPTIGRPFNHGSLKSCRAQYIKALAKISWKKEWTENTKTARQLRRILVTDEDKRGTKLYYNMANRRISTKLAQLRTGHCPLNGYLHRFGKKNSPTCECGYGKETVEHYLLECRKYREQRKVLRKSVGMGRMKSRILLGNIKILKHTVEYIATTRRLE